MKINIFKFLFYLGFILIFVPCFCIFFIPNTRAYIGIGTLIWLISYILCLLQNPKKFINFVNKIFNHEILKAYKFFMLCIVTTSIFHIFIGQYTANTGHYIGRITDFFIASVALYLFPLLSIYIKIPIKRTIKLFYITLYSVLIIGAIQYLSFILGISFVQKILDIFSNLRFYLHQFDYTSYQENTRAFSLYVEPSDFAKLICIMMPFGVNIFRCKYKLFKHTMLNICIKYTLLPLMILNIIFTKSPIYLIFCFIELPVLIIIENFDTIRKYFSVSIFVLILFVVSVFTMINSEWFSNTQQYNRIKSTIDNMTSFDSLTQKSASLACRIVSYRSHFEIFLLNPFFGVGLCNDAAYANKLFNRIKIPLTYENINTYYLHPKAWGLNESVVWSSLSNFGLIGFLLFCYFVYKNFKNIISIVKHSVGIEKNFSNSLSHSLLVICIISFYNLCLTSPQLWIILGLIVTISIYYNTYRFVIKYK